MRARCRCASSGRSMLHFGAVAPLAATASVPPIPSMMFFAIGRPRPVPARRVVKYGSKMCARSSGAMPMPRSMMATRDVSVARAAVDADRRRRRRPARRIRLGGAPARRAARWSRMLTSAVRSRSASVTMRRQRGSRSRSDFVRLVAGPCRGGGGAAHVVDVGLGELEAHGLAKSSTSVTMRFSRRVSSSMSGDRFAEVGGRARRAAACGARP